MTTPVPVPFPVLVPVLAVGDVPAAAAMLAGVFGFAPETPQRMRLGAQVIEIRSGPAAVGHAPIDHLALAVDDLDAALAAARARGARIDHGTTPDGPRFIPEFGAAGLRYVFLDGPEGARIELCARPGEVRAGLPGHDHIGIACRDLPAMTGLFPAPSA